MDSKPYKFYPEDGFDPKQFLEEYLSDNPKLNLRADFLEFPIKNLTKTFKEGQIKDDILIDLSLGPMVQTLFAACDYFKHMIVLKVSDRCILELKRWADSHTGAFDWDYAAKLNVDLEGKSENFQEKLEKVRSAAQHVMKIDLEKENIIEPMVLPPADTIVSAFLLDTVSKKEDDYIKYLKKFERLLTHGGRLIILGDLKTTYYTVGKDKVHALSYDEEFAKKALVGSGFVIDHCEVKKRTAESDHTDYKGIIYIVAHKESEV
ncbi:nicotinamide N-methyltransferase-like [Dendrobates tinctorius]|uniref:nicotinamide N-methyltransferase-like n=1 Tax=Dendrobates tinctorius TaxID=92724 RepID=UPI003CC928ED